MYVPGASTKYCYYCGRANHLANACRYRNIDLAKITRDPQTKQLKKHFNRKPNAPKEEDRNVKPIATSSNNTKHKPEASNGKKSDQIPPKSSFNARKQDKHPVKMAKSLSTSSSKSSNPSDYMRCKDCIKWQMRLHQQADQANYWRDENKKMKDQQNIIDSLANENMKLRKERNHWKDLFILRDRENLDKTQFSKRFSPKN